MAQKFMHYNIVVSCPSDMVGDREKLQNAVAIVNEQNAHFRQMHFDIKYWQKDVLFGVGDPQLIINNSIIKNADMVIALFGSRIEKYIFVTYHSLIRRFVGIDQAWRMRKNLSLLHELEKYFLENTITTLIR